MAAFEKIIALSGIDPTRTAFFEDSVKNLVGTVTLSAATHVCQCTHACYVLVLGKWVRGLRLVLLPETS